MTLAFSLFNKSLVSLVRKSISHHWVHPVKILCPLKNRNFPSPSTTMELPSDSWMMAAISRP